MAAASRDRNPFSETFRSLSVPAPPRGPGRITARRAKLGLESLEDRLVMTTFTVNTFNDTHAAILTGPSAGTDVQGDISLRSAIEAINADPGLDHTSDTIVLPPGTYDLNSAFGELGLHPTDIAGGSTNPITSVTIVGEGGQAIINAQGNSRVLELHTGFQPDRVFYPGEPDPLRRGRGERR